MGFAKNYDPKFNKFKAYRIPLKNYSLVKVGKGKGHPITGHKGTRGGVEV
jgi:hypothetical protein